jgi:hypothetical protein
MRTVIKSLSKPVDSEGNPMSEMNPPLTHPVTPERLDPTPHAPIAGDHSDDDGRALDEFFEGGPWAPVESEGLAIKEESVKTPTRLIGGRRRLNVTALPVVEMLLPADLNRTKLVLTASSNLLNSVPVWLFVSDSKFTLMADGATPVLANDGPAAFLLPATISGTNSYANEIVLDLGAHTGAVWVGVMASLSDEENVMLGYAAVTS